MPRILRIINRLNLGGPTYNAAYLSAFMPPAFETMLVAGMKDDTEESSEYIVEKLGLKPVYIPDMKRELSPAADYKAYMQLRKIIKDFKPDIVHTHAAKSGTLGRLAAIHAKVPVILHTFHGHVFHSYFGRTKTNIFLSIERYLAKKSSAIIAISDLQKKELVDKYKICKEEKAKVISLGFDLDRFRTNQVELRQDFRNAYQITDETLAIGIIGRLVPVKNHPLFIKAIANLKQLSALPFLAFIIGDGEDREVLERLCMEEGVTFSQGMENPGNSLITFTSWIKNIEWALAGLDIVALSSFNEGTPVSLIEAQAAGKPIVSTDVGGIRDVVVENETAFLTPSGDIDAFTAKILLLLEKKEIRNRFAANGWPFVEKRFHYTRLVKDMSALYNELLLINKRS